MIPLRTWIIAVMLFTAFAGCAHHPRDRSPAPPLVLISMDAFRWDYCALHPEQAPRLRELIRTGVSARSLIPAYPSNTFPNHYSIVTGLYPSHHGIINNNFYDPTTGEFFYYNRLSSSSESRWWGGEPIWVTAARQGVLSAVSFWTGSEAEIKGYRPTFWRPYDAKAPFGARLKEINGWLRLAPAKRPALYVIYFEEGNAIGHKFGPDSPEIRTTIQHLDTAVGELIDAFKAAGIDPNIVIVSDHGMTPISKDRIILLDEFVKPAAVQVDFDGPVAGLRATGGKVNELMRSLAGLKHAKAYRTADLPTRFHITANPRNPDVWIVPEEGWEIYFQSRFNTYRDKFNRGDHGYDPKFQSMHGVLIARGPSFRDGGKVVPSLENVHVYNLLCAALRLSPAPNDGDDRLVRDFLRR